VYSSLGKNKILFVFYLQLPHNNSRTKIVQMILGVQ
jgi:hypothetical protein